MITDANDYSMCRHMCIPPCRWTALQRVSRVLQVMLPSRLQGRGCTVQPPFLVRLFVLRERGGSFYIHCTRARRSTITPCIRVLLSYASFSTQTGENIEYILLGVQQHAISEVPLRTSIPLPTAVPPRTGAVDGGSCPGRN